MDCTNIECRSFGLSTEGFVDVFVCHRSSFLSNSDDLADGRNYSYLPGMAETGQTLRVYNEFFHVYKKCFPVKVFKRGYRTRKPWLSDGMKT